MRISDWSSDVCSSDLDPLCVDPLDRIFLDVDQMDGLLVVGLVIIGLHRHALAPEGLVLGYQLFRDRRVLDARRALVGDELGETILGLLVEQPRAASVMPYAIASLVVKRLVHGGGDFVWSVAVYTRV